MGAMMSIACIDPGSGSWISSLATTLLLNVCSRSGWTSRVAFIITGKATFLPDVPSLLRNHCFYASSFVKYPALFSLLFARIALSAIYPDRVVAPAYFNMTAVSISIGSFVEALVEDLITFALPILGLDP